MTAVLWVGRSGAVVDRALLSRVVGVSVTLVALATAVLGTSGVYQRIRRPCLEQICEPFERPTAPTVHLLDTLGISVSAYAAVFTVTSWVLLTAAGVVALVLVWRRPSTLAVVTGLALVELFLGPFVDALAGLGGAAAVLSIGRAAAGKVGQIVLLGLFPDGRWHPAWLGRAWPVFAVVTAGPVITNAAFGWPGPHSTLGGLADVGPFLVLLGFQIHRYMRVSDWTARQQTKWVLLGFLLLAGNVAAADVLDVAGILAKWQLAAVLVAYLAFMLFVFGVAFAVLRYRLYEVSVVLRRTAIYVAAVIVLLVTYLGLVAVASLSMAHGSASILGAAIVAALALGLGVLATRAGGWARDRIFGARGRPGGVAAALVYGIMADGAEHTSTDSIGGVNLAETIATALGLPHAAVLDRGGRSLWEYGEPTGEPHRETIVDSSGDELGTLSLSLSRSTRLDRQESRALREVRPFIVLVLRAQAEAEQLRVARAIAATAREDERRRLRRDLHDGVGPLLAGQLLTVDTLRLATEGGLTSAQLALANVIRHATADGATVRVESSEDGTMIDVTVTDDGAGRSAAAVPGVGTESMRERAEQLGGTLEIGPGPDGLGTQVHGRIPL
jgi:signal transduction histidine kinase